MNNSSWCLFLASDNKCYVWFLGYDNRLRLSYFVDGVWVGNLVPLNSGIKFLLWLTKVVNTKLNIFKNRQFTINRNLITSSLLFSFRFDDRLPNEIIDYPLVSETIQQCGIVINGW